MPSPWEKLQQAFRVRRAASHSNLGAELLFRAVFFGAVMMFPAGRVVAPGAVIGGGAGPSPVGAALGWLGLLLRWWSFVTLGKYFTVVVQASADQLVVDRGPYRLLRHPSYTGLLLAFVGCGLMLGNWVSATGSVVLVLVAVLFRIRIEERALTAAIGTSYGDFAAGRARLIPFVW